MRIVISGGWSYGNIGDEVIADSTIYLFKKYFKNIDIKYTSYNEENFMSVHGLPSVKSVHGILEKFNLNINDLKNVIDSPERYTLENYISLFDKETLFVMSGGGYFTEHWNSQFIARLVEIELAKECGAKVAIIGQSIGPVLSKENLNALIHALSLCDFISVRDNSTQDFLNSLGLPMAIPRYPDLAVVISDLIPNRTVKQDIVGFMPAAYSSYTDINTKKKNQIIEKIRKRVYPSALMYKFGYKKLVRKLSNNYQIYFIMSTEWEWDLEFVKWLCKGIPKERFSVVTCENSRKLCESISGLKYLVSTKMHPLIIATSYGIKAIGISYNFKLTDFMEMIGRKSYCYNIDSFDASKIEMQITDDFNKDNTKIMDSQELKAQVYQMMKMLADLEI